MSPSIEPAHLDRTDHVLATRVPMKQLFAAKLEVRRLKNIYDAAAKLAANTIDVTMTECSNLTATANGRPLETEETIANACKEWIWRRYEPRTSNPVLAS